MIPKKIHYCWFGGAPLPKSARYCIDSWRKYLPDYEIIEWNESNFDVNIVPYTRGAYKEGKYAYVSDYARFYILYNYGGIYFDTDVEVIRSMDNIISNGAFMGYEKPDISNKGGYHVAPGLGIACEPKNELWACILKKYNSFIDFSMEHGSVCKIVSAQLKEMGALIDGKLNKIDSVTIYPDDYFCPKSFYDGTMTMTENTVTIHHYSMSWFGSYAKRKMRLTWFFSRFMSKRQAEKIATIINDIITNIVRKVRFWK